MIIANYIQLLDSYTSDCENIIPVIKLVKNGLMPIIQIGIPILLIILGTIDLGKAVISSDDKEVKASQGRLVKRAISAIAIFFIVTIVYLVFSLISSSGAGDATEKVGDSSSWWNCWQEA